jgi:hypothetical protein
MPQWIANATEADRRAIELNCSIVNAEAARQLKSKDDECVDWAVQLNEEVKKLGSE